MFAVELQCFKNTVVVGWLVLFALPWTGVYLPACCRGYVPTLHVSVLLSPLLSIAPGACMPAYIEPSMRVLACGFAH